MKKVFITLMMGMMCIMFIGCKNNPKNYTAEIEDAVRFQLAVANSLSICEEEDDFLGVYEWMIEASKETGIRTGSCRDLLVQKAENNAFSAKILELYDNQTIILSELQPTQNDKLWTFTEVNSAVRFSFELIPTQSGEVYYKCTANEEDLRKYTFKSLQNLFWDALDWDI